MSIIIGLIEPKRSMKRQEWR